jgi:hypothetical protein
MMVSLWVLAGLCWLALARSQWVYRTRIGWSKEIGRRMDPYDPEFDVREYLAKINSVSWERMLVSVGKWSRRLEDWV